MIDGNEVWRIFPTNSKRGAPIGAEHLFAFYEEEGSAYSPSTGGRQLSREKAGIANKDNVIDRKTNWRATMDDPRKPTYLAKGEFRILEKHDIDYTERRRLNPGQPYLLEVKGPMYTYRFPLSRTDLQELYEELEKHYDPTDPTEI